MTGFVGWQVNATKEKICCIRIENRPENTLIVRGLINLN